MSRQFELAMLHIDEKKDEAYGQFLGMTAIEEQ